MELLIKLVVGGIVLAIITWVWKTQFAQKEQQAEEKLEQNRKQCPSCGKTGPRLWKCELKKVNILFQSHLDRKFDADRAGRRYQYTCAQCGYQWKSKNYLGRQYCDCEPKTIS